MNQKEYIKEIQVAEIDEPNQKDRTLLPNETQHLWRVAGQLNWVSTQTKSAMAYPISVASTSIKDATVRKGKDVISLAVKKAKESCQNYLNCRNISISCFVKQFQRNSLHLNLTLVPVCFFV